MRSEGRGHRWHGVYEGIGGFGGEEGATIGDREETVTIGRDTCGGEP